MPTAPALLYLALLIPLALAHRQQPTQPIHVNVDRVNVGVIVTDSRGHFVEGLRREDFHIFDDGTERPITDFAALDEPAQIVLLLEAGPAVYLFEGGHLRAARALLDGLAPSDRVAIVKYAEAPQAILAFTADKQAASAALDHLHFNLGFGQLNLSSSLSVVLDGLTSLPRKKTVLLLSTGIDTSPENEWGAILARLQVSDVRVLAVSLSGDLQNPLPAAKKKKSPAEKSAVTAKEFTEANHLLQLIAESTGGRAYFPKNAKEFSAAYAEIAQLVRHEYSLAFTPPNDDGQVHSIEVRISDAGGSATPVATAPVYRIDHRRAYFAPTQ
jgi:Ca-activated chloride channel homolog